MVTVAQFRNLVVDFPDVDEKPRGDIATFRVSKKVFATLNVKENRCCLKFSPVDQNVFVTVGKSAITPVPNKWGKQGWTLVQLDMINEEMLLDALTTAYCTVAPPKLAQQFFDNY
jgi:predicted DNA-binding protein (MmcQ/YjbR family)